MRRLFLAAFSFLALVVGVHCNAQQLRTIFPMKEGASLKYEFTDAAGHTACKYTMTVKNASGNLDDGSIDIVYSFLDGNGKPFFDGDNLFVMGIIRKNGRTMTNMESMKKTLKVQDYISLGDASTVPVDMKLGQKLPDSVINVGIGIVDVTITVEEREVKDHRTITLKAGNFDSWLVHEKVTTKSPFSTVTRSVDTWYSEGFGGVKQTVHDMKGKLVSTQELFSCEGVR